MATLIIDIQNQDISFYKNINTTSKKLDEKFILTENSIENVKVLEKLKTFLMKNSNILSYNLVSKYNPNWESLSKFLKFSNMSDTKITEFFIDIIFQGIEGIDNITFRKWLDNKSFNREMNDFIRNRIKINDNKNKPINYKVDDLKIKMIDEITNNIDKKFLKTEKNYNNNIITTVSFKETKEISLLSDIINSLGKKIDIGDINEMETRLRIELEYILSTGIYNIFENLRKYNEKIKKSNKNFKGWNEKNVKEYIINNPIIPEVVDDELSSPSKIKKIPSNMKDENSSKDSSKTLIHILIEFLENNIIKHFNSISSLSFVIKEIGISDIIDSLKNISNTQKRESKVGESDITNISNFLLKNVFLYNSTLTTNQETLGKNYEKYLQELKILEDEKNNNLFELERRLNIEIKEAKRIAKLKYNNPNNSEIFNKEKDEILYEIKTKGPKKALNFISYFLPENINDSEIELNALGKHIVNIKHMFFSIYENIRDEEEKQRSIEDHIPIISDLLSSHNFSKEERKTYYINKFKYDFTQTIKKEIDDLNNTVISLDRKFTEKILDPWQRRMINVIIKLGKSVSVTGPTGGGKTFVSMIIFNHFLKSENLKTSEELKKIIYVAPNYHLAWQIFCNLKKTFPDKFISFISETISSISENSQLYVGTPIELWAYFSINKEQKFDIGIFDEIHTISTTFDVAPISKNRNTPKIRAESISNLLKLCSKTKNGIVTSQIIALSATIKETDLNVLRRQIKLLTNITEIINIKYNKRSVVQTMLELKSDLTFEEITSDNSIIQDPVYDPNLEEIDENMKEDLEYIMNIQNSNYPISEVEKLNNDEQPLMEENIEEETSSSTPEQEQEEEQEDSWEDFDTNIVLKVEIPKKYSKKQEEEMKKEEMRKEEEKKEREKKEREKKEEEKKEEDRLYMEKYNLEQEEKRKKEQEEEEHEIFLEQDLQEEDESENFSWREGTIPVNAENTYNVLKNIVNLDMLPVCIFNKTEEATYNQFKEYVEWIKTEDATYISSWYKLQNELLDKINNFNNDARSVKSEYENAFVKGNTADIEPQARRVSTSRIDTINAIILSLSQEIIKILKKDIENKEEIKYFYDTFNDDNKSHNYINSYTILKFNNLKNVCINQNFIVKDEDLYKISYNCMSILEEFIKWSNISRYSKSFPDPQSLATLEYVCDDISRFFRIGAKVRCIKDFKLMKQNNFTGKENQKIIDNINILCDAEGILKEQIEDIIDLIVDGLQYGVTIILSTFPLVIQNQLLKSLNETSNSSPDGIKCTFTSQSMSMGINYAYRTVLIINTVLDFLNVCVSRQMGGRSGRKGFDIKAFVLYWNIENCNHMSLEDLPEIEMPNSDDNTGFFINGYNAIAKSIEKKRLLLINNSEKDIKTIKDVKINNVSDYGESIFKAHKIKEDYRTKKLKKAPEISDVRKLKSIMEKDINNVMNDCIGIIMTSLGFKTGEKLELKQRMIAIAENNMTESMKTNSYKWLQRMNDIKTAIREIHTRLRNTKSEKFLEYLELIFKLVHRLQYAQIK